MVLSFAVSLLSAAAYMRSGDPNGTRAALRARPELQRQIFDALCSGNGESICSLFGVARRQWNLDAVAMVTRAWNRMNVAEWTWQECRQSDQSDCNNVYWKTFVSTETALSQELTQYGTPQECFDAMGTDDHTLGRIGCSLFLLNDLVDDSRAKEAVLPSRKRHQQRGTLIFNRLCQPSHNGRQQSDASRIFFSWSGV